MCVLRLQKPLRFNDCLGLITSHCSVKEPVLLPREGGGDPAEIVPNNHCLVVWILCRIFEIFSSFVLRHFLKNYTIWKLKMPPLFLFFSLQLNCILDFVYDFLLCLQSNAALVAFVHR